MTQEVSRDVSGEITQADDARPGLLSLTTLTGQIPLLALIAVCVSASLRVTTPVLPVPPRH